MSYTYYSLSVDVDVDLEEVPVAKLERALRNKSPELFKEGNTPVNTKDYIKLDNLNDEMKFEHFVKVFHKYSLSQLYSLLPE